MTELDLELLAPPAIEIRRRKGEPVVATIPGEIDVVRMLELTRIQELGAEHERVLLDTPDTAEFAEQRRAASNGIREFYERAAAIIDEVADVVEGETLALTGTQIVALVSMLVAPAMRQQLLATAYLMVLGVEFDDEGMPIPLADGSPASSSPSGATTGGRARTGGRSSGASGSRSATPRKRKPRASSSASSSE